MSNGDDILKQAPQITTSFPNENDKQIDYVIAFKDNENNKNVEFKDAVRDEFFQKLRQEGLEVKLIEFKTEKEFHTYALLHCPNDRLMIEAEKLKLPVKINKVQLF